MARVISVEIAVNGAHGIRVGLDGPGFLRCHMVLGYRLAQGPIRFEISGAQNREGLRWPAPATALGDAVRFRILSGGVIDPPSSRWDETVYERGLLGEPYSAPMLEQSKTRQQLFGRFVRSDLSNARTIVVSVNGERRACIGDSGQDEFFVVCQLSVFRGSESGVETEAIGLGLIGRRGCQEHHHWTPVVLNVGDVVDLRLGDGAIVDEPIERFAIPKSGT
jgi:hypothetical protein